MQSSSIYREQSWVKIVLFRLQPNARSRSDLVERGFSRQPLRVDVDIARSLEALSHAAWSVPKDKYYDGIQLSVCPTDEQEGRFATRLSVSQYFGDWVFHAI